MAHDEVDQTEDDRSSKEKLINNQTQPKGEATEAGGSRNRWHNGMLEKRKWDKERKRR